MGHRQCCCAHYYYQSGSSKSGYHSTWEELLRVHTVHVPQPDSDRTSTSEPVTQESTQTSTTEPVTEEPAQASAVEPVTQEPPRTTTTTSFQHPNRANQRFHTSETLQSRKVEPPAQLISSRVHGSQSAFRNGNRARSITPVSHQGPSTSHSQLRIGETSSVDFTTSTFSFRAPDRMSYPTHRAPQNGHDPRPIPTGYRSTHSTQASAQMNEAPVRPSM